MKYTIKTTQKKDNGKLVLGLVVTIAVLIIAAYIIVSPPEIDKKTGCPLDSKLIFKNNVVIVDTTDPIQSSKQSDIELLIRSYSGFQSDFWSWFNNGKKVEKTSFYILSSVIPTDNTPVATLCSLPPEISLSVTGTTTDNKLIIDKANKRINSTLSTLISGKPATQSPIIETLAVITGSPSYWTPGSDLILISDIYQNTNKCGLFDNLNNIPSYKAFSPICMQEINTLQENLKPTNTYKNSTLVAVCRLPGKENKIGLIKFWKEVFQDAVGYDPIFTCDPEEVKTRRISLEKIKK